MIETIKNIISSAIVSFECENIILFGSRARGTNREKSDYDILIVLKNEVKDKDKITIAKNVRKKLADEYIDADVIVKTKNEIDYYKDKIGSVISRAVKEGVVL